MASVNRYKSGVVNFLAFPTAADGAVAHAIEKGDLVYNDSAVLKPAAHMGDAGTAAQNRAAFAALFVGVAAHKTGLQSNETSFLLTTDKGYNLVATSGDWEFDCAATAWAPGDWVGVYNDATTNSNQKVAKVTSIDEAIGIAKVPYNALGATTTTVIVELRPKYTFNQVYSGQ